MFRFALFALFVGLPLLELFLLVRISHAVGFWTTIGLVLVTGLVGSTLARQQGLTVWRQMEARLAAGEVPGAQLGHGVLILAAGLLLITPGVITDVAGTLLLLPGIRGLIARRLFRFLGRRFQGRVVFTQHVSTTAAPDSDATWKHVESRVIDSDDDAPSKP